MDTNEYAMLSEAVPSAGFEPATTSESGPRSIRLSYEGAKRTQPASESQARSLAGCQCDRLSNVVPPAGLEPAT